MPAVRLNEIHYDNASNDTREAIEISAPAGTNLAGWSIALYNGNPTQRNVYATIVLSGVIPATCGDRGVLVFAAVGLQNGGAGATATSDPDGIALVDASNNVVEFLSYEGALVAASGVAANMTSRDILVREVGNEPVTPGTPPGVTSLQRSSFDFWTGPGANTFGACNVDPPPVARVTVSPTTATIVQEATQSFKATAFDAADRAIAGMPFTWTISGTAASLSTTGVATGVEPGDAVVTAAAPNGVSATASLRVNGRSATRIVEIHYDNSGADDVGEAIEIEGPAGTLLNGWTLVLYNGANSQAYDTRELTGAIPPSCGAQGVIVATYPNNGIQNGDPDGVALVDESGQVVDFISYEGSFTAADGPAADRTSTDIRVREQNTTAAGQSLQYKTPEGKASPEWHPPAPATFGTCNDSKGPAQPPSAETIVISELMAAPHQALGGPSWGEWFEVHNYGTVPVDLRGWTIASSGQAAHQIQSATLVTVPAGGHAVLGRGFDPQRNGGIALTYNYFVGDATIFLDATDVLELRDAAGALVDRVEWTNRNTMVRGVTRALRNASVENANVDGANWGYSTTTFGDGDFGTPHAANGTLAGTPPPVPNTITFSGRELTETALPVGFQDQLFATLVSGGGTTVSSTFIWSAVANVTIDEDGVMTALGPGTATVRATAADGTTRTYTLPTRVATASPTASYVGNAEFGEPSDGDASDDFLVRRAQYTASYNRNKGIPNWVSYNLEATHFGEEDRCDCFTFDPALAAAGIPSYTTADYTGAGTFHGFGIDRGHLARSFDRTSGSLDNATTFYFTNIIPQAADNNQGPWAAMETDLGNLARNDNREVYVIAGVAGSKGTVKNEGKITIPENVWKVAVIMPRNQRLANVDDFNDLEVIAVIMPNVAGIRNVDWKSYTTTVDAVEALSGYNLLDLLPDRIEVAVESELKSALLLVDQLAAVRRLGANDAKWLTNKLDLAVAHLAKNLRTPAVNQLEQVLQRLDTLVRARKLGADDAESLRAVVWRVMQSLSS